MTSLLIFNISFKKLYLITELCEAGELSKWLKSKGPIEEDKSKIIMRKILEAIRYLHHNSKLIFKNNSKKHNFNFFSLIKII